MKWSNLYQSVFSVLRIQGNQASVQGTGFVISVDPILILTCHHVVSEGTEDNNGNVKYSITKRTVQNSEEFDVRQAEVSFMRAKKISFKPELDVAILEIDPSEHKDIAKKLNLHNIKKLDCSFVPKDRYIGDQAQWLSAGILGDLTLTPRFFNGNIVSAYQTNHAYKFKSSMNQEKELPMNGIRLLEIDKLFIPGCSGGPIVNAKNGKVIGFVHGFKSWPISTNTVIEHDLELKDQIGAKRYKAQYNLPLTTSLSLGIDLRSIEEYLLENRFLKPGLVASVAKRLSKRWRAVG